MDPSVTLFGPVDTFIAPVLIYVILALVVVNMVSRAVEHKQIANAADDGAEAVSRSLLRVVTNILLVVAAFYLMTVERHAGMIISVLALTIFIADLFEFESRKVEARQDWDMDMPWSSIGASVLVLMYVTYQILEILFPFWKYVI